jgi:hypothetical protein
MRTGRSLTAALQCRFEDKSRQAVNTEMVAVEKRQQSVMQSTLAAASSTLDWKK